MLTDRNQDGEKKSWWQSSSYETALGLEGLSTFNSCLQLSQPLLISGFLWSFRSKFMCFKVAEVQVLQVPPGWWVQITVSHHLNRQVIRASHTSDKPGGSSPIPQLDQSLGIYKELRNLHSDSTPFVPPADIPYPLGPLLPVSPRVTSALQGLQRLPFNAKRVTKKTQTQKQIMRRSSSKSLRGTQHCFWKRDVGKSFFRPHILAPKTLSPLRLGFQGEDGKKMKSFSLFHLQVKTKLPTFIVQGRFFFWPLTKTSCLMCAQIYDAQSTCSVKAALHC